MIFGVYSPDLIPVGREGYRLFPSKAKQCIECSIDPSYREHFGKMLQSFSIDLPGFCEMVKNKYHAKNHIFSVESGKLQINREAIGCDIKFIDILRLAHSMIPE